MDTLRSVLAQRCCAPLKVRIWPGDGGATGMPPGISASDTVTTSWNRWAIHCRRRAARRTGDVLAPAGRQPSPGLGDQHRSPGSVVVVVLKAPVLHTAMVWRTRWARAGSATAGAGRPPRRRRGAAIGRHGSGAIPTASAGEVDRRRHGYVMCCRFPRHPADCGVGGTLPRPSSSLKHRAPRQGRSGRLASQNSAGSSLLPSSFFISITPVPRSHSRTLAASGPSASAASTLFGWPSSPM